MKNKQNELKESKELALHYMATLIEVARESFLILDSELRVISASPTFYKNFKVVPAKTENRLLYELGNGQWNIPELKRLLEEILPEKKVVENYRVEHTFESIGKKIVLLNARQIDSVQLIILAMEDITVRNKLEKRLSEYAKDLEVKVSQRTLELNSRVKELERLNKIMVGRELKMIELKNQLKNMREKK